MLRTTLLLAASLLAATACAPLSAQSLVRIDVVDRDSGQWLPEYRHRGQSWIAGTPGHRYGVRLSNTTGERVLPRPYPRWTQPARPRAFPGGFVADPPRRY